MRKFILTALFFLVCFSLFGQAPSEFNIFVMPIAGYGREKDNEYFFKKLAYEVIFQYHRVAESKDGSDFLFRGTIEPISGVPVREPVPDPSAQNENYSLIPENAVPPVKNIPGRHEFFSIEKMEDLYFIDSSGDISLFSELKIQPGEVGYYFKLEMLDAATGEVIGRQTLLYSAVDDYVGKLVSIIVHDLLSNIPERPPKRGDSRDRWMYFETSILWMPRIYYGGYEAVNLLSVGMKLGMELRFISFMSLGVGAQITQEQISAPDVGSTDLMLEVPISLKFVLKIENLYALEPHGGVSLNYSFGHKIQPSKYSWFAGVQFGIKDKSETGMFVIDPRFMMDFTNSVITEGAVEYQRYSIQLGLGYKFGAFQRRK